jgi:hypothetical protein
VILLIVVTLCGPTGCALDNVLNGDSAQDGRNVDPGEVSTYAGALAIYYSAIQAMATAVSEYSEDVGIVTDELTVTSGASGPMLRLDARAPDVGTPGLTTGTYKALQTARVYAQQAADALVRYGDSTSAPLVGHAYALEAHAVVMLAELFCSGVPLTSVPFQHDLHYTPGLSTEDMLTQAVALFDTAYHYGKDSLPIATFAQVGKGRALLDLGRDAEAATAVHDVPTAATYTIVFSALTGGVPFWSDPTKDWKYVSVLNHEGGHGLVWAADTARNQDPRVPLTALDEIQWTNPLRETKFRDRSAVMTVADGIQARLIEAEAALQPAAAPHGPWLTFLNAARATIGLAPLTDPGTAAGRIDLVFRERALWLYLTGTRLGDWRRLVRQYDRLPDQVYPVGLHPLGSPTMPVYCTAYVFVPDAAEQTYNPVYTGCLNTNP